MSRLTRKQATELARFAKGKEEYTIGIYIDKAFKKGKIFKVSGESRRILDNINKTATEKGLYYITMTGTQMMKRFPHFKYENTIKDLEVLFYQVINQDIRVLKEKKEEEKHKRTYREPHEIGWDNYQTQVGDIFYVDHGYSMRIIGFYMVTRTTPKMTEFVRIGKKKVGGGMQTPDVVADRGEVDESEVFRRVGRGTSLKYDDYSDLYLWDGKPIGEFPD